MRELTIIYILLLLALSLDVGLLLTELLDILGGLRVGVLLRDGRHVLALRNHIGVRLPVAELIAVVTHELPTHLLAIPDIRDTLAVQVRVVLTVQVDILQSLGVRVLLRDKRAVPPLRHRVQHDGTVLVRHTVVLRERLHHLDIVEDRLGLLRYHILLLH